MWLPFSSGLDLTDTLPEEEALEEVDEVDDDLERDKNLHFM